jgi:NitT/TauT family transport system substrate-binding protein
LRAIRIGYLSTAYHTSFILIGTDWIKKKMKAKADWRLFPTGPEMIKAFMKGELDVSYIGLPPAMIGIDKGLAIKCIAGGHMEGTVFTAKKKFRTFSELGSVEKVLQQFKGKTIGTPTKGSIHDVIIRNLLEKSGLQQDITIRNFSWADQILEAVEDDEVDGAVGTPPLSVLASKLLGARVILPPRLMWASNPSYGIVATLDMIENSSHTLQNFLKLHEEACNLIRTQPQQAAGTAAKTLGTVDTDFVLKVYGVSPKYCASLPKEYIDSTLAFVPFLQKTRYIKSPLNRDDIFHTKLIEKIHPEKPHYGDPGVLSD